MKRLVMLSLAILLLVAGCAPTYNTEEEVVPEAEDEEEQRYIIPANNLKDETYRTILPYVPGAARGMIVDRVMNRYDIDEVEQGLMRQAKEVFDPEEYFFQEGQYLTEDTISEWLGRKMTEEELEEALEEAGEDATLEDVQVGLNPQMDLDEYEEADEETKIEMQENNPQILSYVHEQNYLVRADENQMALGGIAVALVLKSEYAFQTDIGEPTRYVDIDDEEMLEFGKNTAEQVVQRLRDRSELADVPIMIALYKETEQNGIVPGNFLTKAVVDPNGRTIGEWENIDEKYVLFPSSEAEENHYDHYEIFNEFQRSALEFFPNYIGVIGTGYYTDGNLRNMKIEIIIEFNGKQEVIGFTQHAYGLVQEHFPDHFDVEVNIKSPDRQESIIFREAEAEEPEVYIYQ